MSSNVKRPTLGLGDGLIEEIPLSSRRGSTSKEDAATQDRLIYIRDAYRNDARGFPTNYVSTAKYNAWTFLPKFLYEQFQRYANIFFLFTASIQQIPGVSPTSHFTTIVPLTIVLAATGFKEAFEDVKRHIADKQVNNRRVKVLRGTEFFEIRWRDVKVGDLLRVENGEFFPADMAVISSSEPEAICYIETANLDG
jgi:phospholipid-transporting ATPase